MSIAFLFLLTKKFTHQKIWSDFFENIDPSLYNIYSHIKFEDTSGKLIPKYISKNKIKTIDTKWCGESLVSAFKNMIEEALKNKNNKFFVLLSGECIPLHTFEYVYNKLFNDNRSIINIKNIKDYYYNDQWMILNLYSAKKFIKIEDKFEDLRDIYYDINNHCPDEIYPIYFFVTTLSDKLFKKHIKNHVATYTKWEKDASHPIKIRVKDLNVKEICDSNALFARKFYKNSAVKIAMKC